MAAHRCVYCGRTFATAEPVDAHYRATHAGKVAFALGEANRLGIPLGPDSWATAIELIQSGRVDARQAQP